MDSAAQRPAGWFTDPATGQQLRYFDGTQWTGHVAPMPPTTFPLGEPVILLRALPGPADVDIACSVHDGREAQIGLIRPRHRVPTLVGRETATLVFDLLRPTGAVVLTLTRTGGATKHHHIVVEDGGGNPVGRLRQTSSYWRLFRTSRLDVVLEGGTTGLGSTQVCIRPDEPFAAVETPVRDTSGDVLAVVERRWRYADGSTDFFDYTLRCSRPLTAPLPDLLIATAFAHYLYDRLAVGGPLEAMNRFGRGPGRF
ncbi:DUF2510 domain-containing protein [Mycolicibacterium sp. S2-37]|uniref:DUF2510 domain-containing protein n=1 Tax=Mycolicibacterium sp. S2-37 TaxID=2810297 RepID=UPI001A94F262|nr:DUF2510 domain-containing protein [Mycolicibacterium sp. S2-37]MBO0681351.1 DUF2510 domain-containing protein [Mycolicibacterium sp. S2-37]